MTLNSLYTSNDDVVGKLGNGMRYDTLVSTGFTSPVVAGFLFDRDTASAEHVAGNIRKRQVH